MRAMRVHELKSRQQFVGAGPVVVRQTHRSAVVVIVEQEEAALRVGASVQQVDSVRPTPTCTMSSGRQEGRLGRDHDLTDEDEVAPPRGRVCDEAEYNRLAFARAPDLLKQLLRKVCRNPQLHVIHQAQTVGDGPRQTAQPYDEPGPTPG